MAEEVDMAAAETEPFNWVELWDETYETYYYYNNVTTTSVWEKPQCWLDHEAAEAAEGAEHAQEDPNRVEYPVPDYNNYNEYYGDYSNEDYNQEYTAENANTEYNVIETGGALTDTGAIGEENGAYKQTTTTSEAYRRAYNEYHGDVSSADQSPQRSERSIGASVDLVSPMRSQRSNDPQLAYQPYNTPTRNPFSPGSVISGQSNRTGQTKTPPRVPPLDFNNKKLVERQKKERAAGSPPKHKEDEEKAALLQRIKELEESSATLKESSENALQEQAAQMEKDKEEALQRQAVAVAALKKKEKEDALAQQAAELEAERVQELSRLQKEKEEALVKMEKEIELKKRSAETFALLDSASPTNNAVKMDKEEALLSTEESSTPGPGEGEVLQSGDVTDVLRSFRQERQREKEEESKEAVHNQHQNIEPLDATAVQQDIFLPIDTQPDSSVPKNSESIELVAVDEDEKKEDYIVEENYSSKGFYDFVRSPPRTNSSSENKDNDDKNSDYKESRIIDTKSSSEGKGSSSSETKLGKGYDLLTTGGKNDVIDDFASKLATLETTVDSADKNDGNTGSNDENGSVTSDLSSQGSANWAVVQHQELDSEFMDSMPDDGGDTVGSAGSNEMSEPVIDRVATENALRNQAMLYESSQQLQLGGAVASWAYGGGSIESLEGGQINMLALSSGSIEKVNSIEKGEEAGRSVTFADSNNVLEFKQDSLSAASGDNYEAPMAPPGTAGGSMSHGIAMDASTGFRFTETGNTIDLGNMVIPPYNRGSTLEEEDYSGFNNDTNDMEPYLATINNNNHNNYNNTMADVVLTESGRHHQTKSGDNDPDSLNLTTGGTLDESKSEVSVTGIREERGVMLMSHNLSEEAAAVNTVNGTTKEQKQEGERMQIHTQPETEQGVRHNLRYGGHHSPDGEHENDPESTSPDHPYAYRNARRPPSSPPTSPLRRSRSPSPTYSSSKEVGNERRGNTFGFTNRWLANGETRDPHKTKLSIKYPSKHNDDYVKTVKKKAFVTGIPSHVSAQKGALEGNYGVDKNAKFHPEYLEKLSKPIEDKQLYKVAKPRLGTECANLSFAEIDEMQSRSYSETAVGNIPTDVDKIRFVLRVANVKDDSQFDRMLKKLPKTKKKYNDSQILVKDSDTVDPQVLIDSLFGGKRKKPMGTVNPFTGKIMSPEKTLPADKSTVDKTEYLAENQSLSPFHSMHFLHRYYTRFMVVAFDFHLQFVGTFDVGTKTTTSGLNFEPGKLAIGVASLENPYQRWDAKKRTQPNPRQATVLELDLSKLPANVFAVVPIIFDDCVPEDNSDSGKGTEGNRMNGNEKGQHLKGDIPTALKNVSFEMALYMHRKGVVDHIDAQTYQRVLQEIDGTLEEDTNDVPANMSKARRTMTRKEQEAMLRKEIQRSHGGAEDVEGDLGEGDSQVVPFYSRTLMDSTTAGTTSGGDALKDNGIWSANDNLKFHYVRVSNEKQLMRRKSCAIVRVDSKAKGVPLSLHEAFMPMVMYRRSSAQKGWGYKTINTVTRGVKSNELDHILTTLVETMVKFHIAPYHTLHIEHCRNCEDHCMTTRHIPGSYEKKFEELKRKLSTALPLLTFQQNDSKVVAACQRKSKSRPRYLKETDPRLGSFEVILRPYCSTYSQLLWSKLAKNEYPMPQEMLKVVSAIIEPKTLVFDKSKPAYLDVVIFNGIDKRPMPSVHVMIYYVSVHPFQEKGTDDDATAMNGNPLGKRSEYISGTSMPTLEEDDEDGEKKKSTDVYDDIDVTDNDGDDSDGDSLDSAEDVLAKQREFTSRNQNTVDTHSSRKSTSSSSPESSPRKSTKKQQFQIKSRKSLKRRPLKDIDVAGVSNPAFLKLSAWGKSETLAWLMSHHVSKDCLFFAEMAGVTDGVSLLRLVTESNLVKWGEKNKRTRTAILNDIARMKQSTEQNRDSIGLSNHRLHHMLETSNKLGSSTSLDTINIDTKDEEDSKRTSKSASTARFSETNQGKERVVLSLVRAGQTSMAGVLHANMEKSGSYLIKVFDRHCVTQWSKLIQCKEDDSGTSRVWATALQPRLGKMRVTVSQKVMSFCDNFGVHIKAALVVAFTSLRTGKTFFIRVKKVYDNSGYVTNVGTAHLPIGKYFSHVCGGVFEVMPIKTMDKTTFRSKQNSSSSSLGGLLINYDDTFDEKVCRGHNRALLGGIRTLQGVRHMLRRRRAMKSLNMIGLSITIRLKFKKIIARVRENLLPRRILRIQKFLRCRMRYRQYQMLRKRVIRFQAIVRGKILRLAFEARKAQKILWKFGLIIMRKIKHRRFMKKHNAAVMIQCQWRIKVAYNTMYLQRKLRACTNTSIMTFKFRLIMKVIRIRRRKRLKREEMAREEAENELMIAAEQEMISFCHAHHKHVMMARETERKQLAMKLKQFDLQRKADAIKKHRAATKLQAWARMVKVKQVGIKHLADIYMAKAELMEPTRRRLSVAGQQGYKYMKNIESRITGKDDWDITQGDGNSTDPKSPMPDSTPRKKSVIGYIGTPLAYMNRTLTTIARDTRSQAAAKRRKKSMLEKADNGQLQSSLEKMTALQAKLGEEVGMVFEDSEEETSSEEEFDHFADDEEEDIEEEEEKEQVPLLTRISQSAAVQTVRNSLSKAKDGIKKIVPATRKAYKSTVRLGLNGIRALKKQGSSLTMGTYSVLEYGVDSLKSVGKYIADRPKHRAATKIQAAVRGMQTRAALFKDESYRKHLKDVILARMAKDPIISNCNQEDEYDKEHFADSRQKPKNQTKKGKKEKKKISNIVSVSEDTSTDDEEVLDVDSMRKRRVTALGKDHSDQFSSSAQSAMDRLNALKKLNRYHEDEEEDEDEDEDDDYSPFKRMDKSESPYSPDIRAKGTSMANKPSFLQSLSVNTDSQKSLTLEEEDNEEDNMNAHRQKSRSKSDTNASTIVSSPSIATNKRPNSPSITASLTNTIKSATPKMLNALAKGARTMADGTMSALGVAGTSMVNAAKAMKNAGDDFVERRLQAQARASRKQNSIVGLTDAMLNVSGCATHLPSIDRAWHIGVFPKGAVSMEGGFAKLQKSLLGGGYTNKEKAEGDRKLVVEYNQLYTGSTVQKHDLQEHSRSPDSRPLSSHTFKDLNFYAHLTDLNRYDEMEVVLFVETLGNRYDGDHNEGNEESILSQSNSYYAPAFYGTLSIARGASFAPCGGRMHVKLQPNTNVIYKLPKAKSIMNMADLPVIVTLMPAAIPPSSLLRTFRGNHRAAPVWPAHLVEGSLLEPVHSNWDPVSSSVVAIGSFRDKIIVATNSGGAQIGVYCYDSGGINIGSVTKGDLVRLGVINHICGGWNHVACCSTNGTIMIIEYRREDNATDGRAPLDANSSNVYTEESGTYAWGQPLFVNGGMKQSAITACTMLTHAGLDILFTADKKGHILVAILDNGLCIRNFVNDPQFYPDKIISLCAISNRLYAARDSGILATFDLTTILEKGKIEEAGSLDSYLLSEDPCFRRDVGFKSMCIVSANGFLGLKDEDETASRKRHNKERTFGGESPIHDTLEGHILLVGGGDEEPAIKVLQPQQRGIRLLVTLHGHSKAVTHLQADAAGRYFFSASKEDKSIIVWDGLCFRREKTFKNIAFSSISLGANCLLASHMKPPFLNFYKVFEKTTVTKRGEEQEAREMFMKQILGERILSDPSMQSYVQRMLIESEQTKIATARNPSWCFEKLRNVPKGAASSNSDKALMKPNYVEMREEGEIVFRWLNQYYRMEATSSSYHASIVQQPTMMQSMLGGLGVGKSSPRHSSLGGGKITPRRSSTPRAQARQAYERNKLLQAKEGDMSINEDEYDRIFQALSPEKVAIQNAYNEGMRAEIESKSKFSRKIHRLVHHAHFSDSDEEELFQDVAFIKPKRKSHANAIRRLNKESKAFDDSMEGDTEGTEMGTVDVPGLISPIRSPKKSENFHDITINHHNKFVKDLHYDDGEDSDLDDQLAVTDTLNEGGYEEQGYDEESPEQLSEEQELLRLRNNFHQMKAQKK